MMLSYRSLAPSLLIALCSFGLYLLNGLQTTAYAILVESEPVKPSKFIFRKTPAGDVYLETYFTERQEYNLHVRVGRIYISCLQGSIAYFRLNTVLETPFAELINKSKRLYVGISKAEKMQTETGLVIGSKTNTLLDKPPPELGFEKYVEGYSAIVRDYNPFGVDDEPKIYISTNIDANFFQIFSTSDRISLAVYQEKPKQFSILYHVKYELSNAARSRFLKACVDK